MEIEFKVGQIFRTKNDHRFDILEVRRNNKDEIIGVRIANYVHRDSANCKKYGWKHHCKSFWSDMTMNGRYGILEKIKKGGYELDVQEYREKRLKKVVATVTNDNIKENGNKN